VTADVGSGGHKGLATALYRRLLGVRYERITGIHTSTSPSLFVVLYYAYHKGFWQLIRGSIYRFRMRSCGGRFFLGRGTTILFPNHLSVGRNVLIGDGVFMNCYGGRGVTLGDNVRLREGGWIQVTSHLTNPGEGLVVGRDTYIGPQSILGAGGFVSIGANVTLGARVQILAEDHRFEATDIPIGEQGVTRTGIVLEDGCWIGNNAIILDAVTVGEGAVVGAGAVVTRDVPPGSVVAGNPARPIESRQRNGSVPAT
jgi:acetyltransferase-like isoleucine patch superfamily enzyme